MQKNIFQGTHGGWIVEIRYRGDADWHVIGIYGSKKRAYEVYKRL